MSIRRQSVLGQRVPGSLALLVVLALAGCAAPLEPKSEQTERASTPSPTAPRTTTAQPTASATPSATPVETPAPPVPSVTVPTLSIPPRPTGPILGADISWPQCPRGMGIAQKRSHGSPMPIDAARYVILGLTNGPGFYPNPCLESQVDWVRSRHLMAAAYSVISYPEQRHLAAYGDKGPFDGSTRTGALSNVGYQQAGFNLSTMRRAGLQSPIVWLDVEPVPDFEWSRDLAANASVVRGAARGYTDAGFGIGAYSTQALWQQVVGGLVLGIPEWRAAGQTSRAEALRRCGRDRMFQGGESVLSQWVEDGRDQNVTCGDTAGQMLRWFHQY